MTLRPFGSGSKKTSASLTKKEPSKGSLRPFGKSGCGRSTTSETTTRPSSSTSRRQARKGRKPKLSTAPWSDRLKYLVQLGYIVVRRGDWWVICDRFSNAIKENGLTIRFDNPVDAQKYADTRNEEIFQMRLKELTGRV